MGRLGRAGQTGWQTISPLWGWGYLCECVERECECMCVCVCVNQNWLFAIVTFFALKGRGGVKNVGVRQAEADHKFVLGSLGRQALPPSVSKNKATICNQH